MVAATVFKPCDELDLSQCHMKLTRGVPSGP
jgi:hypothetical protein